MAKTFLPNPPRRALLAAAAALCAASAQATTPLADQPIFSNTAVPGNLALALSVEFPTAVSVAHVNNTYAGATVYMGYFDSKKCYLYSWHATETLRHFYPAGAATNQACATSTRWSGNFLNWATMQTIDPFRAVLTGGYRSLDTTGITLLEKAWASGQGGSGNFPNRNLGSSGLVSANTPFNWSALNMRIQGLGNKMRFTRTGDVNGTPVQYTGAAGPVDSTVYEVSVRVKVCDTSAGAGPLEANCTAYPNSGSEIYKPTGLLQQYAAKIRYSAFGYLNDSNIQRDGGVLRARQKFIGPQVIVPSQTPTANPNTEWDSNTGIINFNPDAADATTTATVFGVPVSNSGVMNYLNKFGQVTPGSYKTYDPVGELYYAAVRYFKKLGNVPEWTNTGSANTATKTTWVDGFPVITTWDDPIQYSCQKNFVLGIGDVNTHADKNVPGSSGTANEPGKPSALALDPVNATTATNKVGALHGLGASLGTAENYGGCCSNNSALMAGVAYDSATVDIRPDDAALPQTKGKQTVKTYWLDILEFQTYKPNNQFYLAAKYGGFKVPNVFDPYTQTTDIPLAWWSTTGETVGSGGSSQARPDTYFVASRPDQMVSGLTKAFASIASDLNAFTTSFSPVSPQISTSGAVSYSAKYDAGSWTGDITAGTIVFNEITGATTITDSWSFGGKLATQIGGTGWDTNRRIVTRHSDTGAGVPFRLGSLSASQQTALDTAYRTGNDAGDYLNYLRGDPTHEEASPAPGSARIYRNRASPVGDIVGSKTRPIGAPNADFSDAANPGYSAFKLLRASRPTMVYVGSNAGMLHAIHGALTGVTAGQEAWAYVPGGVFQGPTGTPNSNGLRARGDPDFAHRFFVDGTPLVTDIDFGRTVGGSGTDWRTVLIGSLGKGGKSYFAIDVTNPAAMATEATAATKVLWEFSHADLGYTYSEPVSVKTKKYGWVLIFGSGYNNADGKPYFFIVNPRTGALLEPPIEAKEANGSTVGSPGSQAGLAQVQAFVLDRTDFTADSAYAGDLLGNLWRLDLTPLTGSYATPTKIAELTDTLGARVPVTSRPLVVVQPMTGKRFVTVGSGRFLDSTDVPSTQPQTFYGIIDGTSSVFSTSSTLPAGFTFPIPQNKLKHLTDLTIKNLINPATQIGWWYDLGTGAGSLGWRVISDPTAFNGVVAFSAMLPNGDVCNASGKSRVYAIDVGLGQSALVSGAGPNAPPPVFIDIADGIVTELRWGAQQLSNGNTELTLIAGKSNSGVDQIKTKKPTGKGLRRLNWRELPLAD